MTKKSKDIALVMAHGARGGFLARHGGHILSLRRRYDFLVFFIC
jgi:hypothetical protein